GVKNRLMVFINWIYNYFTYDQSLRLIFREFYRARQKPEDVKQQVSSTVNPSSSPQPAAAGPAMPADVKQAADYKR
ncbi:MAG TPA: hypothetical protein VF609_07475, partial [Flavisolibacter sp.]